MCGRCDCCDCDCDQCDAEFDADELGLDPELEADARQATLEEEIARRYWHPDSTPRM